MNKAELINLLKQMRETATDEAALAGKELYPLWKTATAYIVGDHRQYGDKLYKCVQAHTSQDDWTPDLTPSLWTVIDATHEGTLEDPIPASRNMEYVKGLYYVENGTIYLMNRQGMAEGESVTLAYVPSELVGQYFEVISM